MKPTNATTTTLVTTVGAITTVVVYILGTQGVDITAAVSAAIVTAVVGVIALFAPGFGSGGT